MSADEDKDIARAIALSLKATKQPEVIDLDSDKEDQDDDETRFQRDLQRALEASKADVSPSSSQTRRTVTKVAPESQPSTSATLFLSERAQLEKERRERQKRLRPEVNDDNGGDDSEIELVEPLAKRQRVSSSSGTHADKGKTKSMPSLSRPGSMSVNAPSANIPTIEQTFWNGEFRQTATLHAEPRKDSRPTFRLTEVLGKKTDLSFAIISSYALDLPWIYEFFDRSVPVIVVAQPDASGQASLKNALPNWIKTTPVLRGGRGCMHMKFMLLFYKTGRLRVVVTTANLIAYDYRDMENTVWLQDLPPRDKPIPHNTKNTDQFVSVLQRMLHSIHVRPALELINNDHPALPLKKIDDLERFWDWSNVKAHLVPSIAGKHEGWLDVIKTGHPRLMKVIRNIGMRVPKRKELILECQGSSLGNYTTQWVNEFYWSARGESAENWLDEPKKRREKLPYPPVKVIFPTKATVQKSEPGEQGGGTIFCRRRQWAAKNFPRVHFYDSKSKGGPVLMHSKMIIATFKGLSTEDSETEDDSDSDIQMIEPGIGWAYIGSHNFTPSAWGTLSGSSFNPILNLSNYELGVVFPLRSDEEVNQVACWERPARKYIHGKDEPWIQEESIYHQDS